MTTRTKRRPPLPTTRSRAAAHPGAIPPDYRRARAATGLALLILVFAAAWLWNGSLTVDLIVRLGGSVAWGWTLHFLNTALEVLPVFVAPYLRGLRLPRGVIMIIWAISLPFGVLDVLASALGLAPWFLWTGLTGMLQQLQNVGLAEIIAFLPEPMLLWLFLALYNVLRSRS